MNEKGIVCAIAVNLFALYSVVFGVCQARGAVPDRPDMVLVQGGSFIMGEQSGEYNPAHQVTLSSFYMARYEATLGLWRQFTDEELPEFDWDYDEFLGEGRIYDLREDDPRPAYFMTWYEALRFCNWLSKKHGLKPVYMIEKRLYAEWDLATGQWLVG